jgi:hypothetical protein
METEFSWRTAADHFMALCHTLMMKGKQGALLAS